MRANDDLDTRLDAALAAYADPEAVPDLAARILASLPPAAGRRKQRRWLPWAVAIPAFAVLLLAVFVSPRHQPARQAASPSATSFPAPVPSIQRPPVTTASNLPRSANDSAMTSRAVKSTGFSPYINGSAFARLQPLRDAPSSHPLPKQEVFPTPAPLTAQEQALAALVNRNPGDIAQSIAESQKQPVEPLTIAAIHIPPLDVQPKGPSDRGGK
jgi:hypothetical protein